MIWLTELIWIKVRPLRDELPAKIRPAGPDMARPGITFPHRHPLGRTMRDRNGEGVDATGHPAGTIDGAA